MFGCPGPQCWDLGLEKVGFTEIAAVQIAPLHMLYRPYHPADFPALYAIEELCFQPPIRYSRVYLQRLIASSGAATWVAEENSQPAGFTIVEWYDEPGAGRIAYIQTIEVAPEFRRRGIAAELLRRAEDSAHAAFASLLWLHVESTNEAAIRLYQAHGFIRQGSQAHYYARGRNADIYSKPLVPRSQAPQSVLPVA